MPADLQKPTADPELLEFSALGVMFKAWLEERGWGLQDLYTDVQIHFSLTAGWFAWNEQLVHTAMDSWEVTRDNWTFDSDAFVQMYGCITHMKPSIPALQQILLSRSRRSQDLLFLQKIFSGERKQEGPREISPAKYIHFKWLRISKFPFRSTHNYSIHIAMNTHLK